MFVTNIAPEELWNRIWKINCCVKSTHLSFGHFQSVCLIFNKILFRHGPNFSLDMYRTPKIVTHEKCCKLHPFSLWSLSFIPILKLFNFIFQSHLFAWLYFYLEFNSILILSPLFVRWIIIVFILALPIFDT